MTDVVEAENTLCFFTAGWGAGSYSFTDATPGGDIDITDCARLTQLDARCLAVALARYRWRDAGSDNLKLDSLYFST